LCILCAVLVFSWKKSCQWAESKEALDPFVVVAAERDFLHKSTLLPADARPDAKGRKQPIDTKETSFYLRAAWEKIGGKLNKICAWCVVMLFPGELS
jgi:hypothetical protein